MKSKINNPYYHIAYWALATIILILVFGNSWGNKAVAFFFISFLLPVVLGTSYFFNYYLVPRYLLKKKIGLFALYFIYTLIVSLFLELLVLTFTFTYFLQYHLDELAPNAANPVILTLVLYLVVFLGSFLLLIKQVLDNSKVITQLQDEQQKMKTGFFQFTFERKTLQIPYIDINYIESLSDYILVNTTQGVSYKSKQKISHVEKTLPAVFVRIHRSFIVNTEKITHFNYDEVELNGICLNIGRSYKKTVMERLKKTSNR